MVNDEQTKRFRSIAKSWLRSVCKSNGYKSFMTLLEDQRQRKARSALGRGDTDFEKGETAALEWVLMFPTKLMSDDTRTETSEDDT